MPLFLNYTRMYHAGKPETCWASVPLTPSCVLLVCVCVVWFLSFFLFGKWRRPSCDFMLWLMSRLFWEEETGTHWDALPGGVAWQGPQLMGHL